MKREREWWEQVVLSRIREHAREYRWSLTADQVFGAGERVRAVGAVLRALRRANRRRALKELQRVSEALGLYEE